MFSSIKSLHKRAMRKDAAQCELDGPRITGPITSLNMLGYVLISPVKVQNIFYLKIQKLRMLQFEKLSA
jgi:hypothetical protein